MQINNAIKNKPPGPGSSPAGSEVSPAPPLQEALTQGRSRISEVLKALKIDPHQLPSTLYWALWNTDPDFATARCTPIPLDTSYHPPGEFIPPFIKESFQLKKELYEAIFNSICPQEAHTIIAYDLFKREPSVLMHLLNKNLIENFDVLRAVEKLNEKAGQFGHAAQNAEIHPSTLSYLNDLRMQDDTPIGKAISADLALAQCAIRTDFGDAILASVTHKEQRREYLEILSSVIPLLYNLPFEKVQSASLWPGVWRTVISLALLTPEKDLTSQFKEYLGFILKDSKQSEFFSFEKGLTAEELISNYSLAGESRAKVMELMRKGGSPDPELTWDILVFSIYGTTTEMYSFPGFPLARKELDNFSKLCGEAGTDLSMDKVKAFLNSSFENIWLRDDLEKLFFLKTFSRDEQFTILKNATVEFCVHLEPKRYLDKSIERLRPSDAAIRKGEWAINVNQDLFLLPTVKRFSEETLKEARSNLVDASDEWMFDVALQGIYAVSLHDAESAYHSLLGSLKKASPELIDQLNESGIAAVWTADYLVRNCYDPALRLQRSTEEGNINQGDPPLHTISRFVPQMIIHKPVTLNPALTIKRASEAYLFEFNSQQYGWYQYIPPLNPLNLELNEHAGGSAWQQPNSGIRPFSGRLPEEKLLGYVDGRMDPKNPYLITSIHLSYDLETLEYVPLGMRERFVQKDKLLIKCFKHIDISEAERLPIKLELFDIPHGASLPLPVFSDKPRSQNKSVRGYSKHLDGTFSLIGSPGDIFKLSTTSPLFPDSAFTTAEGIKKTLGPQIYRELTRPALALAEFPEEIRELIVRLMEKDDLRERARLFLERFKTYYRYDINVGTDPRYLQEIENAPFTNPKIDHYAKGIHAAAEPPSLGTAVCGGHSHLALHALRHLGVPCLQASGFVLNENTNGRYYITNRNFHAFIVSLMSAEGGGVTLKTLEATPPSFQEDLAHQTQFANEVYSTLRMPEPEQGQADRTVRNNFNGIEISESERNYILKILNEVYESVSGISEEKSDLSGAWERILSNEGIYQLSAITNDLKPADAGVNALKVLNEMVTIGRHFQNEFLSRVQRIEF